MPFARPYLKRAAFGLAMNGCARAFDLLPMVVVGRAVDLITAASGDPALAKAALPSLGLMAATTLAAFAGLAIFQSGSDYALDSMAQMIRHDIRSALYDRLQKLDLAFFESRQTGDVMSVLSSDVDNLENFFSDVSTSVVRLVVTFLGTYAILAWLDWRLALLLFVPLPFAVVAVRFFAVKVQPEYRRARQAVGAINSVLENNIQGMAVIQAYTAEDEQAGRIRAASLEFRDASIAAARRRAGFIPLIYLIAGLAYAGLIGGGGWLTLSGAGPSLGDFATFILLAMRLVLPLFVLGALINQIQRSEASAARIMGLLTTEPQVCDAPEKASLQPEAGSPSLEFRDVRFGYPGRGRALNGVSFHLTPGKSVGVVGPTGAGKSTLVKLLLRYYDPDSGAYLIDGRDARSISLHELRGRFGYVSQDAYLFYGTVAENIALGSPDATQEAIEQAAETAGAMEFIRGLPQGIHTLVGERGLALSGGQRQRISLARAILRDPEVLVLDEATSAVDTRTEEIIRENLEDIRRNRMVVAVAHRLSTVRRCEEILVLVDGVVVERGDHDGLVARGGAYARLWTAQSGEALVNGEARPSGNGRPPLAAPGDEA